MIGSSSFIRESTAVMLKDIRSEMRTRYGWGSAILFSISALFSLAIFLDPYSLDPTMAASLLWVIIFFSSMVGLSRSFIKEEESGTSDLLRVSAANNPLFWGKALFNGSILISMEAVIIPLFLAVMGVEVADPAPFAAFILLGSAGLCVGTTLTGAIVARTSAKGLLLAAISFPILVPDLLLSMSGTRAAIEGEGIKGMDLASLLLYIIAISSISPTLFGFVWEN